ncbi:hypothetical protein QVD17_15256 [Tagetes erecta]|uniref:Uncharacterized protein n=1 Tax=Tagetes erecta TaxID=13708 RepID=A0AAD8KVL7_TARER|nr:hypothetical protein QVD17_15256 [Tagetes erecta]
MHLHPLYTLHLLLLHLFNSPPVPFNSHLFSLFILLKFYSQENCRHLFNGNNSFTLQNLPTFHFTGLLI